jgi:hypothetical protein
VRILVFQLHTLLVMAAETEFSGPHREQHTITLSVGGVTLRTILLGRRMRARHP